MDSKREKRERELAQKWIGNVHERMFGKTSKGWTKRTSKLTVGGLGEGLKKMGR